MKHNTYFEGKVQSLGVKTPDGYATVGVMEPGQYTFKTDCEEHMIIIAGCDESENAGRPVAAGL